MQLTLTVDYDHEENVLRSKKKKVLPRFDMMLKRPRRTEERVLLHEGQEVSPIK